QRVGNAPPGPTAILAVNADRVAKRFIIGGGLGFCESYLDGDWTSPDIAALFELALRNEDALNRLLDGKYWYRLLQGMMQWSRINTRRGSRKNIAYHYDLGNDFYAQWLDSDMTYSSAIYENEGAGDSEALS